MYIYNVTVTIESNIHKEWLQWMREIHIPDVMRTGIFLTNRVCKVLSEEDEITYAVQYTFRTMEDMNRYQKDFAPKLQKDHAEKFKNKFAAFRTILEIIE